MYTIISKIKSKILIRTVKGSVFPTASSKISKNSTYAISAPSVSEKESFSEIETRVLKIVAVNEAEKARKINLSHPILSHPPKKRKQPKTKNKRIKKAKTIKRKEQTRNVREQNERILTDERANGGKREGEKESERGNPSGFCLLRRLSELYRRDTSSSHGESLDKDAAGVSATSTTSESLESNGLDTEIPAAARRPRSTRGSQKWSNVRAVMALYSSLRKIKRYSRHCSNMDGNLRIAPLSPPHSAATRLHTGLHAGYTIRHVYTHDRCRRTWYTRVFRTFVATRRLRLLDAV